VFDNCITLAAQYVTVDGRGRRGEERGWVNRPIG
jgi:hypothetical protein